MAGHLAFLARTLQPNQFEFILKHSVHPLIQLEVPHRLCNPGELHFAKSDITSEEAFEQQAVNTILPRPHHPKLANVGNKHTMRCLAATVHYQLPQKLFTKFRDSQANIDDMFGMERKNSFTSITVHTYDLGKKLTKAEKKEHDTCDSDLKKQQLMHKDIKPENKEEQGNKRDPQEEKHQEKSLGDDDDMPMLISDDNDEDGQKQGATKKRFTRIDTTGPRPSHCK